MALQESQMGLAWVGGSQTLEAPLVGERVAEERREGPPEGAPEWAVGWQTWEVPLVGERVAEERQEAAS